MGGLGSGSTRRSWRATTAEYHSFDIAGVRRLGVLSRIPPVCHGPNGFPVDLEVVASAEELVVRVWPGYNTGNGYNTSGPVVERQYWLSQDSMFIQLTATVPRFGGWRYWFICPRRACQRRCRVLYRERFTNARAFACRLCYALAYETQRMSKADCVERRADHIAAQLHVGAEGTVSQPRWMRAPRYNHLLERLQALDTAVQQVADERMARLVRRLGLTGYRR
jgi:hypothetical protein